MTAAEAYVARMDARLAQQTRVLGEEPRTGQGGGAAQRLRADPHREPSPVLAFLFSLVGPDDTVLDVGGGAGRYGLSLALRCREVINVDPALAMGEQFQASAAEAGIGNARFIHSDWLQAQGLEGDVVLVTQVTFFIRDIEPFLRKLRAAARRRVVISLQAVPPPNHYWAFFRLVYGEDQVEAPGYRELLPVLWELGILPDVRILSADFPRRPDTQEGALEAALTGNWLRSEDRERARPLIEAHFDELFVRTPRGYEPREASPSKDVLVTWETTEAS
ncbi:MAG: methyltransferase domain-containing protein [Dehalococcoidia bacterium]|nr:methyltransferase domain-containing protein [Dehalococcoidia bacterium]